MKSREKVRGETGRAPLMEGVGRLGIRFRAGLLIEPMRLSVPVFVDVFLTELKLCFSKEQEKGQHKRKNPEGESHRMSSDAGDLARVISVFDGIGADDMPNWKKGQRELGKRFLRTQRSEKLHKDIIAIIQKHAATTWAKERISLLGPLDSPEATASMRKLVEQAIASVRGLTRDELDTIKGPLKGIEIPVDPVPKYDGTVGIVAENDEIYTDLLDNGMNRWYPVYTPTSLNPDSDLLLYVYEIGNLDIDGENVIMLPMDSPKEAIVPDSLLTFFKHNRAVIEAGNAIQGIRRADTTLQAVLDLLDFKLDRLEANIKEAGQEALKIANEHFTESVNGMQLDGGAILQLLGSGTPEVLKSRLKDAEAAAVSHFKELTGFHLSLNTSVFPFSMDAEDLEEIVVRQRVERRKREFNEWAKRAKELGPHRNRVKREIESLLVFDLLSAIGDFVTTHEMNFPEIVSDGNEIVLEQAAHIKLANRKDCVKVDYHLGGKDNVVILTGANSGGKTTLLETIAYTFILARMGLPVLCARATLPDVEELFFHSRKTALNAGAFESFLKSFIPVVKQGTRKLILADELEAITELDAGARIIAAILSRITEGESFAVVVSHMSEEIGKRIDVRIDGIEAQGLDENLELIVDRNPRIGYRARSTPELIVQRLHTLASGEERIIYEDILRNFKDDAENIDCDTGGD